MKQKIFTHVILLFSLGALTACPPNKSGDNSPNLAPQGRVMSQDSGSYCDLNNGTLTCYGMDQNTGQRCSTLSKSYNTNDRVNLCSQLYRMRSETSQGSGFMNGGFGFGFTVCEVQGALNSAIAQHCQDVQDQWGLGEMPGNPNNPGNPGGGNPLNPGVPGGDLGLSYKSFQCDFEAQRTSSGRWLNTNVNIPRTTALVAFDGRTTQRINLRSKFLGIDIGKFGELTMIYRPGQGGADESIELRNDGLKIGEERVRIVQSGSASQEVRLEALADGLYMRVACRNSANSGNGSPRSRTRTSEPAPSAALAGSDSAPAAAGSGTNLVCTGQSRIVGTDLEEIELILPLNTLANGQEFQISQAVSGKLNGSSITYNAVLDRDFGPTIISTSSLRSASALKANDRAATIDVTCAVQ